MKLILGIMIFVYLISSVVAFGITLGNKSRELTYREVLVLNLLQFAANALVSLIIHLFLGK